MQILSKLKTQINDFDCIQEAASGSDTAEATPEPQAASPQVVYKDATKQSSPDAPQPMDADSEASDQEMVKLELAGAQEGGLKVQLRVGDVAVHEQEAAEEASPPAEPQQQAPGCSGYVPGVYEGGEVLGVCGGVGVWWACMRMCNRQGGQN